VKWRRTAVPFTLPIEIDQPKAASITAIMRCRKSRQFRHSRHPYDPLAPFAWPN
jgi:hypothetical protein